MMRAYSLLLLLAACGGSIPSSPDSGGQPDAQPSQKDSGNPVLDQDSGADTGADAPSGMPTPNGSILALARGPNQNDFQTIVRIALPSGMVTPLFTFSPANGMRARSIAARPDGGIDRFDIEGLNSQNAKTHAIPISKANGMQIGSERVVGGIITGGDYDSNGTLWAMLAQFGQGSHVMTMDAMGNVTPLAQETCVTDLGFVSTLAGLWHGCGEDVFWDDIVSLDATGKKVGDIDSNLPMWDGMSPMASYLVTVDQGGRVQVLDPKTKLWSGVIKTGWSFIDATEDL